MTTKYSCNCNPGKVILSLKMWHTFSLSEVSTNRLLMTSILKGLNEVVSLMSGVFLLSLVA